MKALLLRFWVVVRARMSTVWVSLLLLAAAAALLGASLDQTPWVEQEIRPAWVVWPGLVCGLLLAQTRGPGWLGGLYSLLLSFATAWQVIARPLPPLSQLVGLNFLDGLLLVNLRLHVLAQRLGGWLDLAWHGLPNYDAGFPLLILLLLGWNASAWLAYHTRRRRVFIGLLPVWLLLAYFGNAGGQNLWLLAFFTLVGLLLLALAHFRERIADWVQRKIDYPDELSGDWMAAAATLALAVMLLARASPLAVSPQGWQKIHEWIEPRQIQSAATPAPAVVFHARPPAARSVDLSVIGLHLPESNETVLWVGTSDPPPPEQTGMPASTYQVTRHYWRGGVMTVYTGSGWQAAPLSSGQVAAPQNLALTYARRSALEQTFELPGGSSGMLFAANEPLQASGAALYAAQPDGTLIPAGQAARYRVVSWVPQVDAAALRAADQAAVPAAVMNVYTQLADTLPQRVRDLAALIAGGAQTDYDKALAVQNYLRLTYPYDLTVLPPAPGKDVVDAFLFETRAGFCSHFASAMVVLLRSQGVPARVAVGYLNGDYDRERGQYRVPASAAHAWVEVYFAGYGWIEFEPTPAFQAPRYDRSAAGAGGVGTQPRHRIILFETKKILAALACLLGVGLLILITIALVRFERGARRAKSPAGRLYWRLRGALAWGGLAAPSTVTPLEFLETCRPALGSHPNLLHAAEQLTALYLRDRFSPARLAPQELAPARARWRSVRGELAIWLFMEWVTVKVQKNRMRKISA